MHYGICVMGQLNMLIVFAYICLWSRFMRTLLNTTQFIYNTIQIISPPYVTLCCLILNTSRQWVRLWQQDFVESKPVIIQVYFSRKPRTLQRLISAAVVGDLWPNRFTTSPWETEHVVYWRNWITVEERTLALKIIARCSITQTPIGQSNVWWWHARKMVVIYSKRIQIHCFMANFVVYELRSNFLASM